MRGLLIALLFFTTVFAHAQTAVINGFVTDNTTGEPLPFTHVFLSGTTIVGVTDQSGQYFLRDVPYGSYQLVSSFVGYHQYTYNLSVNKAEIRLGLRLIPLVQDLENVVVAVKEDKEWNRNLKTFKKYFLGQTQNAKRSEIANPWVIDFEKKGNELKARSPEPVEIVNESLGYKLLFFLQQFVASPNDYSIIGPVSFSPMTDAARAAEWESNRLKAYQGSQKHFLKLLFSKESGKAGFKLFVAINALADEERTLSFERDLATRIKPANLDALVHDQPNGTKGLVANNPVEVHYEYGQDHEPLYKDVLHQVSWIQSRTGFVRFDADGNILNPQDVTVVGYWNRLRVADMLPLDYQPAGVIAPQPAAPEKLQIITDRDWYHPGDVVWYSVIVAGQSKQGVGLGVHVALTDSTNTVLGRRLDPVDSRRTSGQFKLPAQKGAYFLTAFTSSSYGRGEIFMKPLLIIAPGFAVTCNDRDDPITKFTTKLTTETDSAGARIGVTVRDTDQDMINGNFIVSISAVSNQCECLDDRPVKFKPSAPADINEGVARGTVTNRKGKPLSGRLLFFTDNLSFSIEKNVAADGRFELADLVSFDSTSWLVQFMNMKNKPVSDFNVVWDKTSEPVAIPSLAWQVKCRLIQQPLSKLMTAKQLTETGFKPVDSVRLLNEVTVTGRRVSESAKPVFRTFGQPQHVIRGDEMTNNPAGVNVLNAINGRFPGLRMNESLNSWDGNKTTTMIRGASALSQSGGEPPLVIVDGIPYDQFSQALDLLQMIPMSDVDRVEVRTGLSPLVGVKRTNGVIAVYTKRTGEYLKNMPAASAAPNPFVKNVSIHGYSIPGQFGPKDVTFNTLHWDHQALFVNDAAYNINVGSEFPDEVYVTIAGFSPEGDVISFRQRVKVD
jgi:hypothetical protein